MTSSLRHHKHQAGFTLIEAVVVIVITGILAGVVAIFIRMPVQNYVDSAARAELSDIADIAMRRMARDVRRALPNSIRVNGTTAVELMLTKTGGRYLSEDDGVTTAGTVPLSFTDPNQKQFTVVGAMPTGTQAIVGGDYIVVYNLGPGFDPSDAYTQKNMAQVDTNGVSGNVITLKSNPFAVGGSSTTMASPGNRFQVVTSPVTYYCDTSARTLTRYWDYAPNATMSAPPADPNKTMKSALLATNVTECSFNYSDVRNTRSALLGMTIALQRTDASEVALRLVNQVRVDNVP
jgi:MSHA biogenesis protein MshO